MTVAGVTGYGGFMDGDAVMPCDGLTVGGGAIFGEGGLPYGNFAGDGNLLLEGLGVVAVI